MNTVEITKECLVCGGDNTVHMPIEAFKAWQQGEYIQYAWPQASAEQREAVLSGMHDGCFDMLWEDDDE